MPFSPNVLPFPDVNGSGLQAPATPYAVLLSCLGDLVLLLGADGRVRELHCPEDYEFLLSPEGIVGRHLGELLPARQARLALDQLGETLDRMAPQVFCSSYALPGRVRDFQVRLAPLGTDAVLAVARDVTDRRHFEKEILEANHRIQSRIGQDLHDGLGQHLTGITFLSRALENRLSERGLPEAAQAQEIARLVIQALAQTRQLARSLFPADLEASGLVPALAELVSSLQTLFKLTCELDCDEGVTVPDGAVANHLFRLAQEAVNNAVKHAQARHLVVQLHREADYLVLRVIDDGQGFNPDQARKNGLGMRIMRYRANKIGACLEILPVPGGGTEVACRLPLPEPLADGSLEDAMI